MRTAAEVAHTAIPFAGSKICCSRRHLQWMIDCQAGVNPVPLCPLPSKWDDIEGMIKTLFLLSKSSYSTELVELAESEEYELLQQTWEDIWIEHAPVGTVWANLLAQLPVLGQPFPVDVPYQNFTGPLQGMA